MVDLNADLAIGAKGDPMVLAGANIHVGDVDRAAAGADPSEVEITSEGRIVPSGSSAEGRRQAVAKIVLTR